jgi:hypothetical protein
MVKNSLSVWQVYEYVGGGGSAQHRTPVESSPSAQQMLCGNYQQY